MIGQFFAAIIEPIPQKKKLDESIRAISDIIKLVSEFGLKEYLKMKGVLTEKNGAEIGKFFAAIITPLDRKKYPDLAPITKFLKDLSGIGMLGVVTLALLKPILTEKFGQNIAGFVKAITNGFTKDRMEKIDVFAKSIKTLSQGVLILTATIGLMAAGIALFGGPLILESTVLITMFLGATLMMLKWTSSNSKKIQDGTIALQNVAKAVTILTLNVMAIALLSTMMDKVEWESIGKVAVMFVMIGVIMTTAMIVSDKWQKGGKKLQETMKGLSMFLLSATAAVGLAVYIVQKSSMGDIILGMAMIAAVIVGGYFTVKYLLKETNKNFDKALKNLGIMVGIMAVTALVIGTLIVPLGPLWDKATVGIIVVGVVMAGLVGLVHWLSKINKTNLKQATNTLMVITGVLTVVSLIALLVLPKIGEQWGKTLGGAVVVLIIVGLMELLVLGLTKIKKRALNDAVFNLVVLTGILSIVSLVAAFLLPAIGKNAGDVLTGFGVVFVIIAGLSLIALGLSLIPDKQLKNAYTTLTVLTVMLVAVSLIATTLLVPIADQWKEVLIGYGVVWVIIAGLALITLGLALIKDKDLKQAMIAMTVLTFILLGVSLITTELLIPIGYEWKEAALGGVVVLGVIGLMTLIIAGAAQIKKEKVMHGLLVVAASAIIFGITAYIINELVVPLGEKAGAAALGGAVVLGALALMTAIIAAAGQMKKETITKGAIVVAACAALIGITAYIIKELVVPVGKYAKQAALGGAVILGTLATMALIVAAAGKMTMSTIAKGLLVIGMIELLLWSMDKALSPYFKLCQEMYAHDKEIALGGLEIVATLTAWGLIMTAVGALGSAIALIAIGGAVIAGIGGILALLSVELPTYFELCKLMHKDWKTIAKGGVEIAATIGAWGVVMTAIGALTMIPLVGIALAVGGAVVGGISTILGLVSKMLPGYVDLTKKVHENEQAVKKGGKLIQQMIEDTGLMLMKIGAIYGNPLSAIVMGMGVAAVMEIAACVKAIHHIVNPLVNLITKMENNGITQSKIRKFAQMFAGKGGLADSISDIIDRMSDVGIIASMKAEYIARNIKPLFDTLGKFIEVIVNMLNMRYVAEWDENGKPKTYKSVTAAQYQQAGIAISKAFGIFLRELGTGLDKLKNISAVTVAAMGHGLKPVISSVAKFTEAIMSVLTSAIPEEWDKEGKPIKFRKFDRQEFAAAGRVIAENFGVFLDVLKPHIEALGPRTALLISMMGKGIEPLFNAVFKYTDMIMGVLVGRDYEWENEKGEMVKKHMEFKAEDFTAAGKIIADSFGGFIDRLWESFSKAGYTVDIEHYFKSDEHIEGNHIVDVINGLQNIGTLIDAINQYIDVLVKAGDKSKQYDLKAEGIRVATALTSFTDKLAAKYSSETEREKIEAIVETMETVKKCINKVDDAYGALVKVFRDRGIKVDVNDVNNLYKILSAFQNPTYINKLKQLNVRDIAVVEPYLKKIAGAVKQLMKLSPLHEKGQEIKVACQNFLETAAMFTDGVTLENGTVLMVKRPDTSIIAPLPQYMKYVIKSAKQMLKLQKIMEEADLKKAVLSFLEDIDLLTQKNVSSRAEASRRALSVFGNDLRKFTKDVDTTQIQVVKFTSKMKEATDSLRRFDDTLIQKENKRNEALKKFADLVGEIAENMNKLHSEFDTLDENKILRSFRGVAELIESVRNRSNESKPLSEHNADEEVRKSKENRNNQQNQNNMQIVPVQTGMQKSIVSFVFANTQLTGFMEVKPL